MRYRASIVTTLFLLAIGAGAHAQALSLLKTLGGLGVSPAQAIGGTKALMGLAKGSLGADEYSQLLSGAPEIGKVLEMTGDGGGMGGALGGMMGGQRGEAEGEDPTALAASALQTIPAGSLDSLLGNADLVKQFTDLGMDASMITKFAPTLIGAVGKMGGPSTASLLSKGLGLL